MTVLLGRARGGIDSRGVSHKGDSFWAYNVVDLEWPQIGFSVPALRPRPRQSLAGVIDPAVPLQQGMGHC